MIERSRKINQHGFTLIEVMVALLILAGLSILMAQSIRTGLQSRQKIQLQLSEESTIRDAMRLIASDIGASFHHRDFTVSNYNKILELRKKKTGPGGVPAGVPSSAAGGGTAGVPSGSAATTSNPAQADPLASATPLPEPAQLTGFNGADNQLTFTTRNHVRRYQNAKESDQATISYFIRNCRTGKQTSKCLMRLERTEQTNEFILAPPDDDGSQAVVLVPFVIDFKLRYIAVGMSDFTDSWDSSPKSTNSVTRGNFPDAVEVTLVIHNTEDKNAKERRLTWLAPVRYSNNPDESEKASPTPGADGTQSGTSATGGRQQ